MRLLTYLLTYLNYLLTGTMPCGIPIPWDLLKFVVGLRDDDVPEEIVTIASFFSNTPCSSGLHITPLVTVSNLLAAINALSQAKRKFSFVILFSAKDWAMSDLTLSTSVYHQSEDLVITNSDSATRTTTIDSFVSSPERKSVTHAYSQAAVMCMCLYCFMQTGCIGGGITVTSDLPLSLS